MADNSINVQKDRQTVVLLLISRVLLSIPYEKHIKEDNREKALHKIRARLRKNIALASGLLFYSSRLPYIIT